MKGNSDMQWQQLKQQDEQCYMNTFGTRLPFVPVKGKGCRLFDAEGNQKVDFLGGIAVNVLGYGDEGMAKTLYRQAKELLHVSNLFYTLPQEKLAGLLFAQTGLKCFFCNSGAEANEGAFKLARKYFYNKKEPRYEIISAINSFHGRTLATVAATGQEKYQRPYAPLPAGFSQVPYGSLAALRRAITPHTAAILLETIQGEGGVIMGGRSYLRGVEKLCRENGILFILDEIQTGMGRTGKLFSYQHYGLSPDIITSAKGLAGGVPIGAVLAKPEVAAAFAPGDHGTTFGGNPLACAAACYCLETLLRRGLEGRASRMGRLLKKGLRQLAERHPTIIDVRGRGLLVGAELKHAVSGKDFTARLLELGYIVNCTGHNTLRFAPPLVVMRKDIEGLLTAMDTALTEQEALKSAHEY